VLGDNTTHPTVAKRMQQIEDAGIAILPITKP